MPRLRVLHHRVLLPPSDPESHELELPGERDVAIAEGGGGVMALKTLREQVASLTGLAPEEQHLAFGDAAYPIEDDVDVRALLLSSSSPGPASTLHVLPKRELEACWRGETGSCTRVLFGDRAVLQPAHVIPGSDQPVCYACNQSCFPPGLLMDAVGVPLRPFVCAAARLCADGLGAYVFEGAGQGLMVENGGSGDGAAAAAAAATTTTTTTTAPTLVLLSSLAAHALKQQALAMPTEAEAHGLLGRLRSGQETVLAYENPLLKAKALKAIPLAALHDRALAAGGDAQRRPLEYQDLLFRELLAWFKRSFFKWVNNPPCDSCGSTETEIVGGAAPTPAEAAGRAGRVEVYRCKACPAQTRFPRYNDPGKLLETRRGRCGEWANCFTLCARAVGFEARYVLDWTDHVWTEVYSEAQGRWLHADACENLADHPLVYEAGWKKELSYVVGFGRDAAVDVTRRYTRHFHSALLARRTEAPEALLARQLASLNAFLRSAASPVSGAIAWAEVDTRLRREQYELRHHTLLGGTGPALKPTELQGRISGSAVWKRTRGEDGQGKGTNDGGQCDGGLVVTCAVPPAPASDDTGLVVEATAAVPVVEREEVAGLSLGGSSSQVPGSGLLVALTSTGAADITFTDGGGALSAFGPEAISVNGMGVAVGTRGLNLVVVDPARGVLERSLVVDAAVEAHSSGEDGKGGKEGDAASDGAARVRAAVANLMSELPQGRVVLGVVLGSGHALGAGTEDAAVWGPGFPAIGAPGRGQAWLVAGVKGAASAPSWAQAVARAEGEGPAKVVFTVPLPKSASASAAAADSMRWEGGIASLPLLHDMGPSGDGVVADPEAAVAQLQAAHPRLPIWGFSFKPGCGLAVFGPTCGVRGGADWTTTRRVPAVVEDESEEEEQEQEQEDVKVAMKRAFDKLVAGGAAPNEAAAQALLVVRQEAEAREQRRAARALLVSYSKRVGSTTRPADGEAHGFDDAQVAVPLQAAAECHQAFPALRLAAVRVWASGRGVTGLQAGYAAPAGESPIMWGPQHRPIIASPSSAVDLSAPPTAELAIAPSDRLVRVEVRPGAEVVEALRLTTAAGQSVLCGRRDEPPTVALAVAPGLSAVAFFGAMGREGLQSLGLVQARLPSNTAAAAGSGPVPAVPALPWGVYTPCAVDRAVRLMLLWKAGPADPEAEAEPDDSSVSRSCGQALEVLQALQSARRYLENCLKEPANPAFRRVRARTAFFYRNIGKLPGSGLLMRALGFQHVAAVAVAGDGGGPEACYELPLAWAGPLRLERVVAQLDANIARVKELSAAV